MPSALLANASLGLLRHFATSFLQRHILQHHFCNVILIGRIILIFRFGQNHRHRPHSCPCRQQLEYMRLNRNALISETRIIKCLSVVRENILLFWC